MSAHALINAGRPVTVVLCEPAPDGQFHLVPITTDKQPSHMTVSASPDGNLPYLMAAIRKGEHYQKIGDDWRVDQSNPLCVNVRPPPPPPAPPALRSGS